MSDQQYNAIPPVVGSPAWERNEAGQDALRAIGVTQYVPTTDNLWYQVIGGLVFQGGIIIGAAANAVTPIVFNVPVSLKVLGVFVTAIFPAATAGNEASGGVTNIALTGFDLVNDGALKDFYWWAIGV